MPEQIIQPGTRRVRQV